MPACVRRAAIASSRCCFSLFPLTAFRLTNISLFSNLRVTLLTWLQRRLIPLCVKASNWAQKI